MIGVSVNVVYLRTWWLAYVEYISIVCQPEADSIAGVHTQADAQLHTAMTSPGVSAMASPTISKVAFANWYKYKHYKYKH